MGFENVVYSLRRALSEAEDKATELRDIETEISEAINCIDEYTERVERVIETIEGLRDLSFDYSFNYVLEDIDISPNL